MEALPILCDIGILSERGMSMKIMKKLSLIILIVFSLVIAGCSQSTVGKESENNNFPEKPIELIVPYDPGGGTDMAARALVSKVSDYLPNNQPVVVVNKPGGAGTVGITEIVKSKADGYTLAMTSTGATSIQPIYGKTIYTHDSFQPIMRVLSNPQVLMVRPDAPWKTYDEWLKYMKKNPGKFTYGTAGTGHTAHIAMESLMKEEGIVAKHVPFNGAGPALTALLGGYVQGIMVQAQNPRSQFESGELRPLINLGTNKEEGYDGAPWLKEEIAIDVYHGLIAPKDTPQEVITILHDAFKKALEDPTVIEQISKGGANPAYAGPTDFGEEIMKSYKQNESIAKDIGLIE